jgi:hypothetical protein
MAKANEQRDAVVETAVEEVIAAGVAPEPQDAPTPERERRTWPCAEEEKDLCELAGEVLEAAEVVWKQANAVHNGRFQTAVKRTRKKVDDMPEINTAAGPKFFLVGLKNGEWREIFQHEVSRG